MSHTPLTRWVGSFDDPVRRGQLLEIPYHQAIVLISGGSAIAPDTGAG
jgi:hypothetical protein